MDTLNFTITSAEDAIKLMEQFPTDQIIVPKNTFDPLFWDLSTRKLGEFLQKLTNYRVKLAVVGDFTQVSKPFHDFIYESNTKGEYLFVPTEEDVQHFWNNDTQDKGCFEQMLAWDFADFTGAGRVHHLTVLCYYLQHPSHYSPEALTIAVGFLRDIVEKKLAIADLYKVESSFFSSDKRTWSVEGTAEKHGIYKGDVSWSETACSIVAKGKKEYPQNVEAWAQSIYDDLKKTGNIHS